MGLDLLRRIRWGNVGRLAGAAALVAAVVAWPRLAPPEPAVPGRAARPLDGLGAAAPAATPPAELLLASPPKVSGRARPRRRHANARRQKSEAVRAGDGERDVKRRRPRPKNARREPGPGASRRTPQPSGPAEPPPAARDGAGHRRDTSPAGESRVGDPAQTEFGFERG